MNSTDTLMIIGAGCAGAELAISARQQGWTGGIDMFGEEPGLPYHRPPLSKVYLAGEASAESLLLRPFAAYEKAAVNLHFATRIENFDKHNKTVKLSNGSVLPYTKLAICTGGRPRPLLIDGMPCDGNLKNLHYLRSQFDADRIRAQLKPGSRLVIIGGGYIGLEVAASARKLGAKVTVLEAQSRVLARVTGPELSAFYERIHRDAGVEIRTGVSVLGIESDAAGESVSAVCCDDGLTIPVDLVVVGIGLLPNIEFAGAAGLEVDGGILVNEFAQSSDQDIYAAGDCAVHLNSIYQRRVRLESVPNALEQARTVAAAVCGKPKAYNPVPWFWSDQYDLKLQMVGLSAGYDQFVVRGSMEARSFAAFYLRNGRVIAADAVNRPAEFMMAKRLVANGGEVDTQRLGDELVPIKELLQSQHQERV